MKSIYKILGIFLILAAVTLSGCIGEDVPADNESDVVIVDESIDVVVDEPVADEPEDVVEVEDPVEDEPEEVISKPSSSGNLVVGVDGTTGHGAEIKAKRAAAEAARLAMLNALSDDLPTARDEFQNASLNFTALNESYINETILMDAFLVAENNLDVANESTMRALENLTVANELKAAAVLAYNESVESCPVHGLPINESLNCTCLDESTKTGFHRGELKDTLDSMKGVEALAILDLEAATNNMIPTTVESIEEARLTMEEARSTMEEAFAYLEECQAAFYLMHPVTEAEE